MQRLLGIAAILAVPVRSTRVVIGKKSDDGGAAVRADHGGGLPHVEVPDASDHADDTVVHMINNRKHGHNEVNMPVDVPHGLTVSHGSRAERHAAARELEAEQDGYEESAQAKASLRRHGRHHEERSVAMDVPGPLPEHGFHGPPVMHEDKVTYTNDWREEYGPGAEDLTTYGKICAKYPDNEWCRMNGHHRRYSRHHAHVDHVSPAHRASSSGSRASAGGDDEGESSSAAKGSEDHDHGVADGAHGSESAGGGHGGAGGAGGAEGHGADKKNDKGHGDSPFHPWYGGGPGSGAGAAHLSGVVLGLATLACNAYW